MTRTNWILFAGSLLILIFVLIRNSRRHAERPDPRRVTAVAYAWPDRPNAYGFVMIVGGDTVIRQQFIPAVQGRYAFASLEDAQKVGDCMARRFVRKPVLPDISIHDLDSLGVKHP